VKITFDREVDALYIRFRETTVTTEHLAEGIAADYDADGRLAGIEILDAIKRLGDPQVFKQVILEDIAIGRLDQPTA
jgi:YD repeat-containing protein